MERTIIQLSPFSRYLDELIKQGRLSISDFDDFEWKLIKNPQEGDVIPGLSGLRKTRLKSMNKGKRGGSRVDYLDIPEKGKLYLIVLYPKNVKEDLSAEEKKTDCSFGETIKRGSKSWVKCLTFLKKD
ncbi:hypothetical protein [Candidatus Protochlamydia sp. R18]|uniref:hypothetical protein n=1 Tax=Candidatus Protochlamydia sp. R18 TaxID=1353977 RepID=UPI0005A5D869|nr:hypothetical protein [Candidatus Protochlamydia sp. R18]